MDEEQGGHARRPRDPETRARDHRQIDRLADDVLPELIGRLTASGLGEIEIREDDWRIRLRLPASPDGPGRGPARDRERTSDRGGAADRQARSTTADTALAQTRPATAGAGDHHGNGAAPAAAPARVIAVSPAVGIFQPNADLRAGTRVRQGDRLGTVDLLGLPQDVVAPEDGVVVDTMAEPGQGVEYGQDLVLIEPPRARHAADPNPDAPGDLPTMGES